MPRRSARRAARRQRARVFWSGRSQAVRLPKAFRFSTAEVQIHREGDRVVLEPADIPRDAMGWPQAFWALAGSAPDFEVGERPKAHERGDVLDDQLAVRYLLDTNVVSFHIRESSPRLQARLRRVRADHVALSVVTEMELRYGLARNPKLRIGPLVEAFLAGVTILPLDTSVAKVYARIRATLEAKGTPIGPLDLMIAAHARAIGATVVTNNLREFRRVPRLRVADWTLP